jgi:2-(1,2-epoxy-1,2-dihydrophenyl)acetyl-CoA isomerase
MNMGYETIAFDMGGDLGRLALNRPDRLNSFTVQGQREVATALDEAGSDGAIRMLVSTGAGRAFCAGQDLSDRALAPGGDAVKPVSPGQSIKVALNAM